MPSPPSPYPAPVEAGDPNALPPIAGDAPVCAAPESLAPPRWRTNLILFVATVLSVFLAGAGYAGKLPADGSFLDLLKALPHGWTFAVPLLSILLLSFHLTQDSLRVPAGSWDAGPGNLVAILILLVYLCGTLLLAERRSGYVIMLLGGIFTAAMPVLHLTGAGLSVKARAFFFLWTLFALGVTGAFSVILAARELWTFKRGDR